MDYQFANAIDLAADELFAQWVIAPDAASNAAWQEWLEQNPAKRLEVEQARRLVRLLYANQVEDCSAEMEDVWQQLQAAMQQEQRGETGGTVKMPSHWWRKRGLLSMAAVVAVLVTSAATLFWLRADPVRYTTGYGEKISVMLPDSSRVVLNGNSTITYTNHWPGFSAHRVYLSGEAFFDVSHKEPGDAFVVHTADGAEVEVLGTEFNVKSRDRSSKVVLASGQVQLSYRQHGEQRRLMMQPGELVEVSGFSGVRAREQVSPERYTAWKDNRVIFDNTSLQEIAVMLEQVYGYKVVIEDAGLAVQKLTANLQEQGVDNILATVSVTLGVRITKQEELNTILISNI